jgi:hypothetical protein
VYSLGPAVAPPLADRRRGADYIGRMRSVGVTCTPRIAYLTLAIDGAIAEAPVERVEVAAQYESSEELLSTLDEIKRAFGQLRPDLVVLLMPEQGRHKRTYQEIAPRVALETLVRIAAVQENIALEVLPRPTVRARLGVPKAGLRELFEDLSGNGSPNDLAVAFRYVRPPIGVSRVGEVAGPGRRGGSALQPGCTDT